jgi:hypothetical protein
MKKTSIINLFILINLINFPVYAENVLPPVWSDYCPKEYIYKNKEGIIKKVSVNIKSFVFGENKDFDEVYWDTRKAEFEQKFNYCSIIENKNDCFTELKKAESDKSLEYLRNNENNTENNKNNKKKKVPAILLLNPPLYLLAKVFYH